MARPDFKLPARKGPFAVAADETAKAAESSYIQEETNLARIAYKSDVAEGESIWLISYSDLMTLLFGFFVMLMSFSKVDVEAYEGMRKETSELFGSEYKKMHQQIVDKIKKETETAGVADKTAFNEMDKGVAITFRGSIFFNPGSADLNQEAKEILQKVIPVIKNKPVGFNVVVEGHTDDSPIKSDKFPSNWELSSHRASAVLRLFEANGFSRSQLRAIGYADTLPVLPNRDAQGKPIQANQNMNRRVVIKLIRSGKMR